MNARLWIGPKPTPRIATWTYKKDMPKLSLHDTVTRIDFGLFGISYTITRGNTIQLENGEWMPVFTACLTTPGWVIGCKDATTADARPWAEEWRATFHGQALARFDLMTKAGR